MTIPQPPTLASVSFAVSVGSDKKTQQERARAVERGFLLHKLLFLSCKTHFWYKLSSNHYQLGGKLFKKGFFEDGGKSSTAKYQKTLQEQGIETKNLLQSAGFEQKITVQLRMRRSKKACRVLISRK